MDNQIPLATIQAFARSMSKEAAKYGFSQLDMIRLVNELLDSDVAKGNTIDEKTIVNKESTVAARNTTGLPISGRRLRIRSIEGESDVALLNTWLSDRYGRYFVLSSTAEHSISIDELISEDRNFIAMITTNEGQPFGALAYLDRDTEQKRAELRKLIGDPAFRGQGLAEEATRLWIEYGVNSLDLEKIYVSTLQTHLSNIRLNEKVGFHVEGLLRDEVLIDGTRHDVLRMGYCKS
jgi:RimJ/RimL family protein N-acetyltransferase